jgi:hypothetical protein
MPLQSRVVHQASNRKVGTLQEIEAPCLRLCIVRLDTVSPSACVLMITRVALPLTHVWLPRGIPRWLVVIALQYVSRFMHDPRGTQASRLHHQVTLTIPAQVKNRLSVRTEDRGNLEIFTKLVATMPQLLLRRLNGMRGWRVVDDPSL